MACDLRCPNCEDNLGKDTENSAMAYCSNCGEKDIYNEYGDVEGLTDEELKKFNKIKRKTSINTSRLFRKY